MDFVKNSWPEAKLIFHEVHAPSTGRYILVYEDYRLNHIIEVVIDRKVFARYMAEPYQEPVITLKVGDNNYAVGGARYG